MVWLEMTNRKLKPDFTFCYFIPSINRVFGSQSRLSSKIRSISCFEYDRKKGF